MLKQMQKYAHFTVSVKAFGEPKQDSGRKTQKGTFESQRKANGKATRIQIAKGKDASSTVYCILSTVFLQFLIVLKSFSFVINQQLCYSQLTYVI